MLGPLPALHRFVLVLCALGVGIATGAWLGLTPDVPMNVRLGLLGGTGAGLVAAFVLVHDFHEQWGQPARVRRRTH